MTLSVEKERAAENRFKSEMKEYLHEVAVYFAHGAFMLNGGYVAPTMK